MVLKKALVIRFSSIGDIVLCSPVIKNLKKYHPHIEIDVLTKSGFVSLWQHNPHVNTVLEWGNREHSKLWKNKDYDVIIDLHHNLRSRLVKWQRWDCLQVSFEKRNLQKSLYVLTKNNIFQVKPLIERYADLLQQIGVENKDMSLEFYGERSPTSPFEIKEKYIALVLGGSFETKKVPLQKWIDFVKLYDKDMPLVLLGSTGEIAAGAELFKEFPHKILNFCGKLSLMESASLVKNAQAVVSGDTGLGHIAAAFGVPLLWIWGNTSFGIGMFPPQKHAEHLMVQMEVERLKCRPCSKLGYHQCPQKHFKCMDHNPEIWKQNLEKLIGSGLG